MPTNFTQEERNLLLQKFYKQGDILLKTYGYKKMKVSLIADEIGIGTGTFYHFFKSKDEYVLWLIKKRKLDAMDQFNQLANKFPNGIPMHELESYFFNMITNYNIYRYLNQEEYNHLQNKYDLLKNRDQNIEETAKYMMQKLDTTKSIESFKQFSECYTMIIIGTSDLTKLNKQYTDDAIKALIHAACSFLY